MRMSQPAPELPVKNVRAAQAYYRDYLGFTIEWFHQEGRIGAVSHGDCVIFFRELDGPLHPSVFWVFVDDVDAAYAELQSLGADIVEPVADKPWGLRQFTLRDLHDNRFHFHHDIGA